MTMPHLMNCPHSEDWCLSCVKEMHQELENAEAKAAALDKILAAWGITWEQYKSPRTDTKVLPVDEQMQRMGTDVVAEFTAADYLQTGKESQSMSSL